MSELERLVKEIDQVRVDNAFSHRDGSPELDRLFVRAILQALRNPDEGMLEASAPAGSTLGDRAKFVTRWQRVIDHILNEEAGAS